jgi:hypothetical protein
MEPSQTRLQAAGAWHKGLTGKDAPDWDDVEIAVRLRITDELVARQVLFGNRATLLARWRELQAALDGTLTVAPAAVDLRDPTSTTPDPVTAPGGVVGERFKALMSWLESARSAGRDVEGLVEAEVLKIAEAAPNSVRAFKAFGPAARANDRELLAVLQGVSTGGSESIPKVASIAQPPVAESAKVAQPSPPVTGPAEPKKAKPVGERRTGLTNTAGFAEFDYAAQPHGPKPTPAQIVFSATGDESLELGWPEPVADGMVRIFRVITNDTYPPIDSPTLGQVLHATFDCSASDTRDFVSPVRYVAIWLNEGATDDAARAAQPSLYAAGGCVLPVRSCEVREDEGTVIGQWLAIDGVLRVDVLRVPIEQAVQNPYFMDQYRLAADSVGKGGFTDNLAQAGDEYEYRVYAVASVSGSPEEFSPAVARTVKLQAVVNPVNDLKVTLSETSESTYDLSWSVPPLGKVEIYRSESQPAPGIHAQMITRQVLVREGLTTDLRLSRPLHRQGDHESMRDVPWPKGTSRAYFTPVTVLNDDQIRVGRTEILTRASSVSHVKLIERVDEQFLTFAWPAGVTLVKIFRGPRGSDVVNPEGEMAIHELSEDEYAKFGGAHLKDHLPSDGCSVHVVGTSYTRGNPVYSDPVTIDYRGLMRLRYDLVPIVQGGRFARRQEGMRQVLVTCETAKENVPFVLVHNPGRLPLYIGDGRQMLFKQLSFVPNVPQVFADQLDLSGQHGFVRLFVQAPPDLEDRVAVLDPPVDHLRCG